MPDIRLWMLTAVMLAAAAVGAFSAAEPPRVDPTPTPYRVIGVWEGKVAVFLPEGDLPETVLDTRVATLPAEERERLMHGVEAADAAMLRSLLEDYGS